MTARQAIFVCTGTASSKTQFFLKAESYTISTWVNSNVVTGAMISYAKRQAIRAHISSAQTGNSSNSNITDGWESVGYAPNLGWTHLVGVRNGANEYLYVNGVMVDNTISTNSSGPEFTKPMYALAGRATCQRGSGMAKSTKRKCSNVARDQNSGVQNSATRTRNPVSRSSCSPTKIFNMAYSRKVKLKTRPRAAPNVATTQSNFPVLIRFDKCEIPFARPRKRRKRPPVSGASWENQPAVSESSAGP